MKSALKKLSAFNKATLIRTVLFSVLFVAFYVLILYVLITSPA